MEEYVHWKKLTNPDYIGAYSFLPGEKKILTIDYVKQEMVCGADGKKEQCIIAHLIGEKPLVLCRTNCKAITEIAGTPNIMKWKGVKIAAEVKKVKAFGEIVEAVRISNKPPAGNDEPKIPCEDCGEIITPQAGMTAKELAEYFKSKCGKYLCYTCAVKFSKKMSEKSATATAKEKSLSEHETLKSDTNKESEITSEAAENNESEIAHEDNENKD